MANVDDLRDPKLGLNPFGSYVKTADGIAARPKKKPPRELVGGAGRTDNVAPSRDRKSTVTISAAGGGVVKKAHPGNWVGAGSPRKYKNAKERRMAERYAIGSDGKSI